MVFIVHLYNVSITDPYPFNGGFWRVHPWLIRSFRTSKVTHLNPKGILTGQSPINLQNLRTIPLKLLFFRVLCVWSGSIVGYRGISPNLLGEDGIG